MKILHEVSYYNILIEQSVVETKLTVYRKQLCYSLEKLYFDSFSFKIFNRLLYSIKIRMKNSKSSLQSGQGILKRK